MFMKIKKVSSNRRSKTGMGLAPKMAPVLASRLPQASGGGLGGCNWVLHRSSSGTRNNPRVARGGKSARGGTAPIKMLKMKIDPEMYMKTKDRLTQ
jgi:hypothetical protein